MRHGAQRQRGQLKDLAGFGDAVFVQFFVAHAAVGRAAVNDGFIDVGALAQCAAAVARLPAIGVLARGAQRFGRGFAQSVARWWAAGVAAVERQLAFELLEALLHHRHVRHELLPLLPQRPDQRVLLRMAELIKVGEALHGLPLSLSISQ